jgi:hypothetical protein
MICCTYQQNLYLYTKITKLLPIIMPLHTLDRHLQVNSSVPNKRVCTFFSGKLCLLTSIEDKRPTLLVMNVHTRLFGTLE